MKKRDLLKNALFLGGTVYAAGQLLRSRRALDFAGRTVVITGGSRGLGLILARLFSDEGAKLALLALDADELQRAKDELQHGGGEVLTLTCDVTSDDALRSAIDKVAAHYGGVDVLINNAGSIAVGPLEHMSDSDFTNMMDLHCWAALHATRAALPHLKKVGGRVVNIASIGGLVTPPHLSAYNVSKFALVGLSGSLRAELAKDGVLVTTVCPGTMRTGSHVNAQFKGRHDKEFQIFELAAGLPGLSADARTVARRIVEGCRHGDAMVVYPATARLAQVAAALLPNLMAEVLGIANRLMPPPTGPEGDKAQSGWDSQKSGPSAFTPQANKAITANNELRGHPPLPVPETVGALNGLNGKAHH